MSRVASTEKPSITSVAITISLAARPAGAVPDPATFALLVSGISVVVTDPR